MNVYRIRNKKTGEFIKLNSGKHIWFKLNHCTSAISNHNGSYSYKKAYDNKYNPIFSEDYEIVEFDVVENNKIINIKDKMYDHSIENLSDVIESNINKSILSELKKKASEAE